MNDNLISNILIFIIIIIINYYFIVANRVELELKPLSVLPRL